MKNPLLRRSVSVVIILLFALLLIEGVIQLLALGVHFFIKPQNENVAVEEGKRVVVCVGDSFTFGMGASDPETTSYPARLEHYLNEATDDEWQVINAGYPAKNSQEMAEELVGNVKKYNPDYVIFIGAVNDLWKTPELVPLTPESEITKKKFKWEYRTGRLISTLTKGMGLFSGKDDPEGGKPPGEGSQVAQPDSSNKSKPEKATKATPKVDTAPTEDPLAHLPAEAFAHMDKAWKHHGKQEWNEAADAFQAAADAGMPAYKICPGLAFSSRNASNLPRMKAAVNTMEEAYRADPTFDNAMGLIEVLGTAEQNDKLRVEAGLMVEKFPDNYRLRFRYMQALFAKNEHAEARKQAEITLTLLNKLDKEEEHSAGWFHRTRARLYSESDQLPSNPDIIASSIIEQHLLDRKDKDTIQTFQTTVTELTAEQFETVLDQTNLSQADKQELLQLRKMAVEPEELEKNVEIARKNMVGMIEYVRSMGGEAFLGSYPINDDRWKQLRLSIKADTNVETVELYPSFAKKLETMKREDLYIGDGHPNDTGYDLMAKLIAEAMLEKLINQETKVSEEAASP